jgi:hypothetical protein
MNLRDLWSRRRTQAEPETTDDSSLTSGGLTINWGAGPILMPDTATLTGDERIDLGDGRTIAVADLLADLDVIKVEER